MDIRKSYTHKKQSRMDSSRCYNFINHKSLNLNRFFDTFLFAMYVECTLFAVYNEHSTLCYHSFYDIELCACFLIFRSSGDALFLEGDF